jgi:hypothetical protein
MNTQMQELDRGHLDCVLGGNPFLVPIVTGIAVGVSLSLTNSIVNNWDNFKAGLFGEPDPALSKSK